MTKAKQLWTVYLLRNRKSGRTYIGSTTDVKRRLRQHNREIVGGARSTRLGAPDWQIDCFLTGFATRSEACRWERILKCRARGLPARAAAFLSLYRGICPAGRRHYDPPTGITIVHIPDKEDV